MTFVPAPASMFRAEVVRLYMYIAGSHNMPLNCAKNAFIAFFGLRQCIPIACSKKCNLSVFLCNCGPCPAFNLTMCKKYALTWAPACPMWIIFMRDLGCAWCDKVPEQKTKNRIKKPGLCRIKILNI